MVVKANRASSFIRQFAGPGEDSDIVCFKFWQLVPAAGCAYKCAYCFLQALPWFKFNPDVLMGMVYTNWEDMVGQIEDWLESPIPMSMIVGELQDGLLFDSAFKQVNGKAITELCIPLFAAQKRHQLIFLTKSVMIKNALALAPTNRAVFSWSVNSEYISKKYEEGTPPASRRFDAARKMKDAGWRARLRLDPMIPYKDWKSGYAETIDRINDLQPEMVTLGALRATSMNSLKTASKNNGRRYDVFDYLTKEKDPSGFKHRIPEDLLLEMYGFVLEKLKAKVVPALCKEDKSVWEKLGMKFKGCHCLLGADDPLARNIKMERRQYAGVSSKR